MDPLVRYLSVFFVVATFSGAIAGQAVMQPLGEFIEESSLVAVVEVTKVTQVDVPTGDGQFSSIYVAAAKAQVTLKSDFTPRPNGREIAIIGSTIPRSSAVWRPIKTGRYLAFLKKEQGHYRYGKMYAFRPINRLGEVAWIEKDETGAWKTSGLKLKVAIAKIQNRLNGKSR